MSVFGESSNGFPKLPILSPAEIPPPGQRGEPRSQFEKYGGLFYLGIAGLALLAVLVAWFGFRFWSLRDVWTDVYVLHDPAHSDLDRIARAQRLAGDPRVNDDQRMEICLRRDVPDLARYLLAESVSTDAVARDPRSFSLTVARSPVGLTGCGYCLRGSWRMGPLADTPSRAKRFQSLPATRIR